MHLLLGAIALRRGERQTARDAFLTVTRLAPQLAAGFTNLGLVHAMDGNFAEAVEVLRTAHALAPSDVAAAQNLALALGRVGEREESRQRLEALHAAAPDDAATALNYARSLFAIGDARGAYEVANRTAAHHPRYAPLRELVAYYVNYLPEPGAREICAAQAAMHRDLYPATRPPAPPLPPASARSPLRVAYLSGDLREHSVAYFLRALFTHHDRRLVRVAAITTSQARDDISDWFDSRADDWIDISGDRDDAAAARLQALDLDLLIDLAGNTIGGRPGLLALRPARRNATYLGYPTTSGFAAIDFRISDAQIDPPGADDMNTEQLLRLPGSMFCYTPPEPLPAPPAQTPAHRAGRVTFGCFNKLAKVSAPLWEAWMKILAEVPDSRLLLKADELTDPLTRERLAERAAASGIDASRLLLLARDADRDAHLQRYQQVDIALDSWPYNGATTTCEALMMGVPVVSWRGATHASRMGSSILTAAGVPELVAADADGYQRIAVGLASDLAALDACRARIAAALPGSALLDGAAFTRAFETLLYDALGQAAPV